MRCLLGAEAAVTTPVLRSCCWCTNEQLKAILSEGARCTDKGTVCGPCQVPGHKPMEEKLRMEDRLTLLLYTNARGDDIIKPLLVYHSKNPQVFSAAW